MNELPAEIEVAELSGGVRYRLPRRNLGGLRYIGLFVAVLGLFFTGFAMTWMVLAVAMFWQDGNGMFDWIGVIFAMFGIPFVLTGLAVLGVGGLILWGRSEVELRDGRVHAIERLGPFRYSWFRPVEQIHRFVVSFGGVKINHQPVKSGPLADLAAIKIECKEGKPVLLAPGYPRGWLLAVANDLAGRCQLQEVTASMDAPPPIPVVEERHHDDALASRERLEKPAGSDVVLQEDETGVTLTVPPAGLRKGSQGLFTFSIIWLTLSLIFGGIIAFTALGKGKGNEFWVFSIVMPTFVLVGVGMLLAGVNMGKRRAVLAVVGDRLLVMQTGIFGSKRHEWRRADIMAVCAGPSGMEVNSRPVLELQVQPAEGRKVGLLAGRDHDELHWMANVLARTLKLHEAAPAD